MSTQEGAGQGKQGGCHSQAWRICMAAGEASGDMQGALLVRELKRREPDLQFAGMGSTLMERAGVRLLDDCRDLGAIGLVEVVKRIPRGLCAFARLKRLLRGELESY